MINIYSFETLTSTMDEARDRVQNGADEGTVIVADRQSKGRGRRGRLWESLSGNLHYTYITYVNKSGHLLPELSFVVCVALGEEIRKLLPPPQCLTYKWPNDLMLNEKKVGGILLEAISLPDQNRTAYLLACGLNLAHKPSHPRYPATSFSEEGLFFEKDEMINKFSSALETTLNLWKEKGFSPFQERWMTWAAGLNKSISFEYQGKSYEGLFKGIDSKGGLMLESRQGLLTMNAGEIISEVPHASRD